jgi:hypothetical protein
MHKLVHIGPKSALFDMFRRPDGSVACAFSKILPRLDSPEVIADLANHCLRRFTLLAVTMFDYEDDAKRRAD